MEREQYGSWSILNRKSTLERQENTNWKRYTDNRSNPSLSEVLDFVWNYQIKEMYLRYFAWQFIGKGDADWEIKNKDGTITKYIEGINLTHYLIPLAFILGIVRTKPFKIISVLIKWLFRGFQSGCGY